jgi:DtxR family Mn-dependent transcriptional regulator
MVKRLAGMKLVRHEPYRGVVLEPAGEKIALEVLRHHRLVEQFLSEVLGVPWDEVHDEAEKWEHVLSEEMEDRIDVALGFPTCDPHGSPIPGRDLKVARRERTSLAELAPGESGTVAEVSDESAELLRYVGELGLYPGTLTTVVAAAPLGGPLTIRVGKHEHPVSREVARMVRIARANAA